jgi:RIO kinase 1
MRMLDERFLRQLESDVDSLRKRDKDSDSRKTYDQVFDRAALLNLAKLISDGAISTLDYPVSTGKEANVFHATDREGRAKAVKIYRINTATFRNIAQYIEGDSRFRGVRRATKPTILAWARKEHKNLLRMADAGVRVPKPHAILENILVMTYIGDESRPAPLLREVALEDPGAAYEDVLENMQAIRRAALVHADLSEYNLLVWDGRIVVIDVGQAVPLDHHRAAEWFARDVGNVARYFRRLGVDVSPAGLEAAVLGG